MDQGLAQLASQHESDTNAGMGAPVLLQDWIWGALVCGFFWSLSGVFPEYSGFLPYCISKWFQPMKQNYKYIWFQFCWNHELSSLPTIWHTACWTWKTHVLHIICAQLSLDYISMHHGNSLQHSEETVKNLDLPPLTVITNVINIFDIDAGRNSSVGSLLGLLSCMMQICRLDPPLSLK